MQKSEECKDLERGIVVNRGASALRAYVDDLNTLSTYRCIRMIDIKDKNEIVIRVEEVTRFVEWLMRVDALMRGEDDANER